MSSFLPGYDKVITCTIETVEAGTLQHGLHFGTDVNLARKLAKEIANAGEYCYRETHAGPYKMATVRTVAIHGPDLFDTFDPDNGWNADRADKLHEDLEAMAESA